MRAVRLVSSLGLAALLVMMWLVFTHQSGQAKIASRNEPETEVVSASGPDLASFAALQAVSASSVISNHLDPGDELVHGLTFYKSFLWGSTRYPEEGTPLPARILKIDPDALAVLDRVDLGSGQTDAEDIIGAQEYLWAVLFTSPAQLIRVNPASNPLTYTTAITFPVGYGASLDYAFGYLWVGLQNNIARVDITDPLTPTYQLFDFSSLAQNTSVVVNALSHDSTSLWASFYQCNAAVPAPACFTSGTMIKADPLAPTSTYTATNVTALFPDDMTFAGQHLYVASEAIEVSNLYRFAGNVTSITTTVYTSPSYGTFSDLQDPTSVWSTFVGDPGVIINFDLDMQKQFTLTLPVSFTDPAEIAFDPSGNIYVSTWEIPTGLVKYPVSVIPTPTPTPTATVPTSTSTAPTPTSTSTAPTSTSTAPSSTSTATSGPSPTPTLTVTPGPSPTPTQEQGNPLLYLPIILQSLSN